MMLRFAALLLLSLPLLAQEPVPPVDKVMVNKSERTMWLLSGGEPVREYRISLGREPKGHKLSAGDNRTPEGRYYLNGRNPDSDFHKSLRISYPNERDRYKAESWGLDPGNNIMIHGLPNDAGDMAFAYEGLDWTNGCIAVTNEEIEEIWHLVGDNTPILIKP